MLKLAYLCGYGPGSFSSLLADGQRLLSIPCHVGLSSCHNIAADSFQGGRRTERQRKEEGGGRMERERE